MSGLSSLSVESDISSLRVTEAVPDDPTRYLDIFFLATGLPNERSRTMRLVNILTNIILWAIFFIALEFAVFDILGNGEQVQFYVIGVLIFNLESCTLYSTISYSMHYKESIISFIKEMSELENNEFGRYRTNLSNKRQNCELREISALWLFVTFVVVTCNLTATLIIFGPSGTFHDFLPFITKIYWVILLIPFVFILNLAAPASMIITRISSYFVHQRICDMIVYMEEFLDGKHGEEFPIVDVMGWYDSVYQLNRKLSRGLSPYVTVSIMIGLPHCIFLTQVCVWANAT